MAEAGRRKAQWRAARVGATSGSRVSVVLAALLLTLADAAKPLVVDDTAYVYYAEQIRREPTDPYGFEILWYGEPQPALSLLAPPVLPYWLAGGMALFGDAPVYWKLWLFPFALVLAASLRWLLTRFATGLETPLLWMAMLSPPVLPFMNLMLDVPALALALAAIAIFLDACDRGRSGLAAVAGMVAGVAMQTKYSAAAAPLAIFAYGSIVGHRWRAWLAAGVALAVFFGWEGAVWLRYGESHLVRVLGEQVVPVLPGASWGAVLRWTVGLVLLFGAMAPANALLALVGLGASRRTVGVSALTAFLGFAAIPLLPAPPLSEVDRPGSSPRFGDAPPEEVFFAILGLFSVAAVAALIAKSMRGGSARDDRFLLVWLAIEVGICVLMSPFLAARRLLGISTVALLLCGRGAARTLAGAGSRSALHLAVGFGIALGLLYGASDLADARTHRNAVREAERALRALGVDPTREAVWFVGHWGFRFYAERAGMQAAVPRRPRRSAGDWLVVPEGVSRQAIRAPNASPPLAQLDLRSGFPWSTLPWAYLGPVPLRPRPELHVRVWIHRILPASSRGPGA